MRCRKLQKLYTRYVDDRLSERRSRLVEEHLDECARCAAEVESLQKVRSLLRTAGESEPPEAYWDTYWSRLEKKLPEEPTPLTLRSRVSDVLTNLFRQPAVMIRIAAYIILIAFLIYTTPEHLIDLDSRPSPSVVIRKPSEAPPLSIAPAKKYKEGWARSEAAQEKEPGTSDRPAAGAERFDVSKEEVSESLGSHQAIDERGAQPLKEESTAPEPQELPRPEEEAEVTPDFAEAQVDESQKQIYGSAQTNGLATVVNAEDEYAAAEGHFESKDYLQAIPAYQNFLVANTIANEEDPRNLRAQFQIGEAYFQTGNYSEALSNFAVVAGEERLEEDKLAETDKNLYFRQARPPGRGEGEDKSASARQAEERARFGSKLRTRARPSMERDRAVKAGFADKDQKDAETRQNLMARAMFRLAESYERLGKREEAITTYRKYLEKYPKGEHTNLARNRLMQMIPRPASSPKKN